MERGCAPGGWQAAVRAESRWRSIRSPVGRRRFVQCLQPLRHGAQRHLRLGLVDAGQLGGARWIDPDRHRRVRRRCRITFVRMYVRMYVREHVRVPVSVIERCMGGGGPWQRLHAVVVVVMKRRADDVERHQQHQQPACHPARASPAVGVTASSTWWLVVALHGRVQTGGAQAPWIRTLRSFTELTNTSTSGPRWMMAASIGPIQPSRAAVMPSTCTTPTPTNRFSCTVR